MREASSLMEEFLSDFFHQNAERYAYGHLFEPIYDDLAEYVLRRGKRIRPLLLLASYRLFGGARPFSDLSLLRAATAVELFHSFILIHDDVIDRSEVRRGQPTFHKLMEDRVGKLPERGRLGQNLAIVVGDMVYALAIDTLLDTDFEGPLRDAGAAPLPAIRGGHRLWGDARHPPFRPGHRPGGGGGHHPDVPPEDHPLHLRGAAGPGRPSWPGPIPRR